MLVDQYNRSFPYLRLSVTELCNFKCTYCLPDGYKGGNKKSFLTLDEINTLVTAFSLLGTEKIRITGGEPTLRKDIVDIVNVCAANSNIKKVALTTNGYRLPDILEDLISAGVTGLNLSVDSLDPTNFAKITGHDKLHRIMESIEMVLAAGFGNLKLNTVLLRQTNGHEFDRFLSLVKKMPVTVRFIELMRTNDNHAFFAKEHLSANDIKSWLLSSGWQQISRSIDAGPAEEYFHPDYRGNIGLIMPYAKNFCDSCNRLRVSAQGKLNLCLFAGGSEDLRPLIASGNSEALADKIQRLVYGKQERHQLVEGCSGDTQNLSLIGG